MFDQIEKLKQQLTDKFVEVTGNRPELARFQGHTGQVKTVNMSGRALVQFEAWNNIAWYDIEPEFLKLVPKPEPKAEAKHEPAKKAPAAKPPAAAKPEAASEKKPSAVELARQQGAAKAGGKASTADIIAAARSKTADGGAAPATSASTAKAPGEKLSTADILEAARTKKGDAPPAPATTAAKPAAKPAGGKMSTADIIAAARAKKAEAAPAPEPEAAAPAEEEAPVATLPAKAAAPAKQAAAGNLRGLPTAEKIAYCREHDTK